MNKLITLCIAHFICDFVLQSRKMGTNKSSSYKYLGQHIAIIFIGFLPFGLAFALLNSLIHAIIDKHIWTLYKVLVYYRHKYGYIPNKDEFGVYIPLNAKTFKYYEDYYFYLTIGFDQMLHIITLIILVNYV